MYDSKDKNSIIEYAKLLKDKTLRQLCEVDIIHHGYSGKGNFGQLLEKFYFGYEPNSKAEADFAEIGMELKSSPIIKLKKGGFSAKERLSLSMINYEEIVDQSFENSSFFKKNLSLLLVFYLHQAGADVLDLMIKLIGEWDFSKADIDIIKNDWELIQRKVKEGKAHELSEGDTFYLGASTKGANAASMRKQPFSDIPAKRRAYSFKQGYVNHIIASITGDSEEIYGKLMPFKKVLKKRTIEDIVLERFKPYYGKTIEEICAVVGVGYDPKAKGFYDRITKAVLGIELDKDIEEFKKAEIIVRTVRLKENDLPKEDVSFPHFKYMDLVKEEWENSEFKELLEHKFLFVFFQFEKEKLVLRKVRFWNMPYADILEAEKVWARTKENVKAGNIVKEVKKNRAGKAIRSTYFPNKKFSTVAHVRPHGRNAADTQPLPIKDKLTQEQEYTKQCFWLNGSYVRDEIFLK